MEDNDDCETVPGALAGVSVQSVPEWVAFGTYGGSDCDDDTETTVLDLTEIHESLAALLDISYHIPTNCGHDPCPPCARHRAIIKRARAVLALLTPATLVPLTESKE